jgi:hypothetical protein
MKFQHEVVDHAVEYVRGEVHASGLENFWSLPKRGLGKGKILYCRLCDGYCAMPGPSRVGRGSPRGFG